MNNREAFEAWYKKEIDAEADFFKHPATGLYAGKPERHFFNCWRAALASQVQQPALTMSQFATKADYEAAMQSQAQQESQEIGEMRENGVNWYGKNPHAFAVGTKFFALPPAPEGE